MKGSNYIQYLPGKQIDRARWDECIDKAGNGLIYAYSFYLDYMAQNWDALVLNDYEVVMPLTWKKKYGIYYLYQPFLTAQLGVFGKTITEKMCDDFIQAIPSKFRYIDISLNSGHISSVPSGYSILRINHILSLNKPYEELYKKYRENIQRNIKKAEQAGCKAEKGFDIEKIIVLAMQQMKSHSKESADNVNRFRKLYRFLEPQKKAIAYGISLQDELLASAVFFFSHNRAYYILVGNNPTGKTLGASHALIDAFIKDHAGENMLLDFEGSDIPSLAFFYSSFGASEIAYPHLKINRLPFYLKLFKK
ncbi:MAG TPA: GNAT family N-acetyltransferase [Chitinophagaceae bacterium]|nr:GNAT family N-acetyltransferase [Chitinophagaceae bacterium]